MEKVALSSTSSRVKIVGTVVSISGAFIVAFYKGPGVKSHRIALHQSVNSSQSNWITGSLFLAVEYLLVPLWYIIQVTYNLSHPTLNNIVPYRVLLEA